MKNILLIGSGKILTDKKLGIKNLSRCVGPSLGLLSIGSLLQKNGARVEYFCPNLESKNWRKKLKKTLCSRFFDFVGIANTAYTIEADAEFCHFIKQISPQTKIITGGYFSHIYPKTILQHTDADIVIRGEGEIPFLEIIKEKPLKEILGVCWREKTTKGEKYFIKKPYFMNQKEFNSLPPLDFSLYDYQKSWETWSIFRKEIDFYTSKGCPFCCRFCSVPFFNNRKMRFLPAKTIRRNLINANQLGIRKIFLVDPNFTASKKHLFEVCNLIILLKQKRMIRKEIYFLAQARIEALDKNELKKMKEAGFRYLYLGIENISSRLLQKDINKKSFLKEEEILKKLKLILEFNIIPYVYLIFAPPKTTKKELIKNLQFALLLRKRGIRIEINPFVTAYPETEYFQIYKNTSLIKWREITLRRMKGRKTIQHTLKIPDILVPENKEVGKILWQLLTETNKTLEKNSQRGFSSVFLEKAKKYLKFQK